MTNAKSDPTQPTTISEAHSSPQDALICPPEKGEGEESFPLSLPIVYRKGKEAQ